MIEKLLTELGSELKKANPELMKNLRPGLPFEEIDRLTTTIDIRLPEMARELFHWRNGTNIPEGRTIEQNWIFPLGFFMPINRAVDMYHYHHKNSDYWRKNFFLLFESGGGQIFMIDCDGNSDTYGMIYKYDDKLITHYDSLKTFLETMIESYKTRVLHLSDDRKMLVADDNALNRISKKHNPKSTVWELKN
jgi:hypothetical protein